MLDTAPVAIAVFGRFVAVDIGRELRPMADGLPLTWDQFVDYTPAEHDSAHTSSG